MSMLCRQKAEIFETPKYVYDAVRLEHFPAALNQGDSQLPLPGRIWRN